MQNNFLSSGAIALALVAASGCTKKKPKDVPAPPTAGQQAPGTNDGYGSGNSDGSVGSAALEAARADFIARAGSDTIYFNTDRYQVDDANRATLNAQAAWLLANPNVRVTVEGHADERGTREYNLALGDRRANAAMNHLASQGVPSSRMTVVSWGKERPAATGSDERSWAQNRRSVTVLPQ